eukprot:1269455-Rhodomonas_salina.2
MSFNFLSTPSLTIQAATNPTSNRQNLLSAVALGHQDPGREQQKITTMNTRAEIVLGGGPPSSNLSSSIAMDDSMAFTEAPAHRRQSASLDSHGVDLLSAREASQASSREAVVDIVSETGQFLSHMA